MGKKPFESCYGTSTAKQENENGDVSWECYRSCPMLGTTSVGGRKSVCKDFSQNARKEMFMEGKLQGCPVFVQYNGVLRFDEVWKVFWSCLSSVMLFGMCLITLL